MVSLENSSSDYDYNSELRRASILFTDREKVEWKRQNQNVKNIQATK